MQKRISKINFKGGSVAMTIVEDIELADGATESRETKFLSTDTPHPDFEEAWKELPPIVEQILFGSVDDSPWLTTCIKVTGISISYNKDSEVQGAVLTASVKLDQTDGRLLINTPHLPYAQYQEKGELSVMPENAVELLEAVEEEANEYLKGKRAQEEMFKAEE